MLDKGRDKRQYFPTMSNDLVPSIREEKMGFVLQTLVYPDSFELQKLGNKGKERMEEAIAIVVDDDNRIKRCQFSHGYIHEHREKEGWKTAAVFSDLDELQASRVYVEYQAGLRETAGNNENGD